MIRFRMLVVLSAICWCVLCVQTVPAQANLLRNGDFEQGNLWWTTSGTAMGTDYAGIPEIYSTRWNLSSWQSAMDGNFMLLSGEHNSLDSGWVKLPSPISSTNPLTFSLDYAIAWDHVNPVDPGDYGYFYVEFFGRNTSDGISRPLNPQSNEREIDWGIYQGVSSGVFTGSLSMPAIIPLSVGEYDEVNFSLLMLTPNSTLFEIAGFDNAVLTMNQAAPVPEPSTLALSGFGLAGVWWRRGRKAA